MASPPTEDSLRSRPSPRPGVNVQSSDQIMAPPTRHVQLRSPFSARLGIRLEPGIGEQFSQSGGRTFGEQPNHTSIHAAWA